MTEAGLFTTLVLGPVHGLLALVGLVLLALKVWALVDACIRRSSSFVAAAKLTKPAWVAILVLAVVFGGLGILGLAALVASIVYLVDVRPAVREVRRGGGPYGGW